MKNKKILDSLSIIIIGLLLYASLFNIVCTEALQAIDPNDQKIDTFDRTLWEWNKTEVISINSISDSHNPSTTIDSLGNVHITWHDTTDYAGAGTDSDIFYKSWNKSSSSWLDTVVISTESTAASSDSTLVVDSLGNVHITWWDDTDYAGAGTDSDIFYKSWNKSSSSWLDTVVISTESTAFSSQPSLDVDSLGNVHIAWCDGTDYAGAGPEADIFYKWWNAFTSTWNTTEVVSTESTDKSYHPSLDVDSLGNVHIAWDDISVYAGTLGFAYDIFYKWRNNATSTWSTTEVVSYECSDISANPSLAVDSVGSVHLVWEDKSVVVWGPDWDIF